MYLPPAFRVDDEEALYRFVDENSFATVVTHNEGEMIASHLPVLLDRAGPSLLIHLARPNPQVAHLEAGAETLCIFHGPHAYVSPSWYATAPAVPTWNYAAVHAYGKPSALEDDGKTLAMLGAMVARYEAGRARPWTFDPGLDWNRQMLRGIRAFSIAVTRLEGKFKMSQNRSAEDRVGVIRELSGSGSQMDRQVAELVQAANSKRGA